MADRYWVGGTATWNSTAGTKWATTSGGAGGASVPTSSDNVFFDANSTGTITFAADSTSCNCANLDFTGCSATFAYGAGSQINVYGNLTLVAGITWPTTPSSTNAFNFKATATGKTITSAGKIMPNLTFDGVGGGWTFQDNQTGRASGTIMVITLTNGSIDLNGKTFANFNLSSSNTNTRTLTMGAASFTILGGGSWDITDPTNLTFSGSSATITATTAGANTFNGGGLTYGTVNFGVGSSTTAAMTGANTFTNLTLQSASGTTTGRVTLAANQTISSNLNLTGNSQTARAQILSNTAGTSRTLTCNGTVTPSNAILQDITGAGSASWSHASATGFGDGGRNSGITFTTAINIYWFRNTGNLQTTANLFLATNGGGGAARVPLPQDTLFFDANSFNAAGQTFTITGGSFAPAMDFTGTTNSPTVTFSTASNLCGSITLIAGLTISGTTAQTIVRAATITTAGKTITAPISVNPGSGNTVTFADAYNSDTTSAVTFSSGTIVTNSTYDTDGATTFSGGTITFGGACSNGGNLTFSGAAVTLGGNFVTTGATSISGGSVSGASYTVSGGTTFSGSNAVTWNASFNGTSISTLAVNASGSFTFPTLTLSGAFATSSNFGGSITIGAGGMTCTTCTIGGTGASGTFTSGAGLLNPSGAFAMGGNGSHTVNIGAGGLTCTTFTISAGASVPTLTLASGATVTLTGTGTVFANTGGTITANSASTIVINDTSATGKTFQGNGKTFGNITFSGDNITITGSNTFNTIALNNAGLTNGLKLTASTTQTVTDLTSNGSAGNLTKMVSTTATNATINSSSPVDLDYIDITDITAANNIPFYAGTHSVDGGDNTNWLFSDRPTETFPFALINSGLVNNNLVNGGLVM